MLQADFLSEILPLCKQNDLHVALDTCGTASWESYERVLSSVDLVLYDLKIMDPAQHQAATGLSNARILENARRIAQHGMPMWIRTPVIPGYTDAAENIAAVGRFIKEELPTAQRCDLLAYTNLGQPKYHRLDRVYPLEKASLLPRSEMEAVFKQAIQFVPFAQWSGATR
jgi:pyruvate formate lyase activating enzyme